MPSRLLSAHFDGWPYLSSRLCARNSNEWRRWARVHQPTEGMVVVPKSNSRVPICIDLTRLNQSVKRERNPLPAVDQTAGRRQSLHEIGRQFCLFADPACTRIFTVDDVHYAIWALLFPSTPFWDFVSPGAFPVTHVGGSEWPDRNRVHDG